MNRLLQITQWILTNKARILLWGIAAFCIGLIAYWAVYPNLSPPWTGFSDYQKPNGDIERAKTLWDWMNLLIIPIVLAIGVWLLNRAEKITEQQIARNRSEEETLQMYLDRMTDLLLKENLRESTEQDEVRSIARSRTLTALRGLDGPRKGLLIRFLWESRVILDNQLVKLKGADVSRADLRRANLTSVNLSFAILNKAILSKSRLSKANLNNTQLVHADLSSADMVATNLHMANLTGANLSYSALAEADLGNANLERANLMHVHLRKANLRSVNLFKTDLTYADLTDADLTRAQMNSADLRYANLAGAKLCGTNLQGADLRGAILDNADLSLVNLTGAKVNREQLAKASSLAVAVMMNGKPRSGGTL